jgi:hypothetical protein
LAEVELLQDRDKGHGRILFVDVSADTYSPEENADITFEEVIFFVSNATESYCF